MRRPRSTPRAARARRSPRSPRPARGEPHRAGRPRSRAAPTRIDARHRAARAANPRCSRRRSIAARTWRSAAANSRDAVATARRRACRRRAAAGSRTLEAMACCAWAKRSSGCATTSARPRPARRPPGCSRRWGSRSYEGRAWWALSAARSGQGRVAEDATARRTRRWRWPGAAATCTASATRSTCSRSTSPTSRRACACCSRRSRPSRPPATSSARRSSPTTSATCYSELGLYRRARRCCGKPRDAYRRAGSVAPGSRRRRGCSRHIEHELGHLRGRQGAISTEAVDRWEAAGMVRGPGLSAAGVRTDCAVGGRPRDRGGAVRGRRPHRCADADDVALEINALDRAERGVPGRRRRRRGAGGVRARHRDSSRARSAEIQGIDPTDVVVAAPRGAARQRQDRGRAPGAGHRVPVPGRAIASSPTKGCGATTSTRSRSTARSSRRLARAQARRAKRRPAHLAGKSTLREPFERLVDTGLRLNELRSAARAARIPDRRGDRALRRRARAAGAGVADGLQLAGSLVPKGEDAQALLQDVAPALDDVAPHARGEPRARAAKARRARAALAHRRAARSRNGSSSAISTPTSTARSAASTKPTAICSACSRARPRSRSTTRSGRRGSSRRSRSAPRSCSRPTRSSSSARTSSRSSTASSRAWRPSSTSRRSSTWSATSCARSSQTGDLGIRWFDENANLHPLPVRVRARQARAHSAADRRSRRRARARARCHRRASLVLEHRAEYGRAGIGASPRHRHEQVERVRPDHRRRPRARLDQHRELRARVRVRRRRRAAAHDGRREHGRRARERPPLRRDAAPAEGDRAARARSSRSSTASSRASPPSSTSRAIVDLVGDKLREVLRDRRHRHPLVRRRRPASALPLRVRARRAPDDAAALNRRGRRCAGVLDRRAASIVRNTAAEVGRAGQSTCPAPTAALSARVVPIVGGDRVARLVVARELRARARVRRRRGAAAATRRRQHGRRARERAPVRRDAAAAEGDRAARRRARGDQQHPAGHGGEARLPGHRRPRRRQAARGVRHRRHRHPLVRPRERTACTSCTSSSTACASTCRPTPRRRPTAVGRACVATREPIVAQHARREGRARLDDRPGHRPALASIWRADRRRRPRARHRSCSRTTSASTPSATPTCACCRRSPRAWASRSRTRACSTRRSGRTQRDRRRWPTSAATFARRSTSRP